jgi:phenylacetate-CoA ligase
MGNVNRIIKKAPGIFQKMFYENVPFSKRYGKPFVSQHKFLMESITWSRDQLLSYQEEEFRRLITHCFENVPYYKDLFSNRNLVPSDFRTVKDLELLPYLTKKLIRENYSSLIATNMKGSKVHSVKTSGSTGEKLVFSITDDVFKKEAAYVLRAYQLHGASLYDKPSIWLRRFVPANRESPLWYTDYELKRIYMSAYHLNDRTINSYIEAMNSTMATTLVGYPSSAFILALLCERNGVRPKFLTKIHVSSEMMLDEWRTKIIDVLGIVPVAHYGAIEKVSFMHQLELSTEYFQNFEYGINEFIPNHFEQHDLVATGFLNYYMPFLRYRTEDSVSISDGTEGGVRILSINGRSSDILIAKDGSYLPGVNFYSWIDKSVPGVAMFQLIQTSRESVTMNFVASEKFAESTIMDIKNGLKARLGDLEISIIQKSEIERNSESGKIRCIINETL